MTEDIFVESWKCIHLQTNHLVWAGIWLNTVRLDCYDIVRHFCCTSAKFTLGMWRVLNALNTHAFNPWGSHWTGADLWPRRSPGLVCQSDSIVARPGCSHIRNLQRPLHLIYQLGTHLWTCVLQSGGGDRGGAAAFWKQPTKWVPWIWLDFSFFTKIIIIFKYIYSNFILLFVFSPLGLVQISIWVRGGVTIRERKAIAWGPNALKLNT